MPSTERIEKKESKSVSAEKGGDNLYISDISSLHLHRRRRKQDHAVAIRAKKPNLGLPPSLQLLLLQVVVSEAKETKERLKKEAGAVKKKRCRFRVLYFGSVAFYNRKRIVGWALGFG